MGDRPQFPLSPELRPSEAIAAAAFAFFAAVAVAGSARLIHLGELLTLYGGLALILAAAVRCSRLWPESDLVRFGRAGLPALFFPLVFDSLASVTPYLRADRDAWLVAADRAIFGTDPTVWLERFAHPLLSDAAYFAYGSYYLLPVAVGLALFVRRRDRDFERLVGVLALTFYLSYAGYLVVPAIGPRYTLAAEQKAPLPVGTLGIAVRDSIEHMERNKRDCFPSGHTMITLVVLACAWRMTRRLFWFLLPIGSLLIFATVYCRYHYVVDVIAGAVLAIPCYIAATHIHSRWESKAAIAR